MYKLKPCPFCGGEAREWNNGSMEPCIDENGAYVDMDISSPDMFGIECTQCSCQNIGYATKIEAIETQPSLNKYLTMKVDGDKDITDPFYMNSADQLMRNLGADGQTAKVQHDWRLS